MTEEECEDIINKVYEVSNEYFWKRFTIATYIQVGFTTSVLLALKFAQGTISETFAYASITYTISLVVYFWKLKKYRNRFLDRVNNIPTDFRFKEMLIQQSKVFDAEFFQKHAERWITQIEEDVC
jgi:hypothetical protein